MKRPSALGWAAAALVLVLPVLGFVVLLRVLTDRTPVDCSQVLLPPAQLWRSLDGPDKQSLAGKLSLCSRLDGQQLDVIEASLGTPDQRGRYDDGNEKIVYLLPYAAQDDPPQPVQLQLSVGPDGRVVSVQIVTPVGYPY